MFLKNLKKLFYVSTLLTFVFQVIISNYLIDFQFTFIKSKNNFEIFLEDVCSNDYVISQSHSYLKPKTSDYIHQNYERENLLFIIHPESYPTPKQLLGLKIDNHFPNSIQYLLFYSRAPPSI